MSRWAGARTRSSRPGGLVCALLLVVMILPPLSATPADVPRTFGDAPDAAYALAAENRLFGRFEEQGGTHRGSLVTFTTDPQAERLRDLRLGGTTLIEELGPIATGTPARLNGSVATISNSTHHITLHDNRYAWISYGARAPEVHLRFPAQAQIEIAPEGLTAKIANQTLILDYVGNGHSNVSVNDTSIVIRPRTGILEFTITMGAWIGSTEVRPGSWWLLAHAEGTTVADVLRPSGREHEIEPQDDRLDLHAAALSPDRDQDAVHRIESVGFFPRPPRIVIEDTNGGHFPPTSDTLLFQRAITIRASNVTLQPDNLTRILIRQPFDFHGPLVMRHDDTPPRILDVRLYNLTDDWQPETRPLEMEIRSDEPVTAQLTLGPGPDARLLTRIHAAPIHRIPLNEIEPRGEYTWELTITDLAGNTNSTQGNLTTTADPNGLTPLVRIHRPEEGKTLVAWEPVELEATVTDGAGRPLPPAQVTVTLDGRPVTDGITWDQHRLHVSFGLLEDGRHTAAVTAVGRGSGPTGEDTVGFRVGYSPTTPSVDAFTVAIALVALLHVAGHTRHTSSADLDRVDDALQRRDRRQ